MLNFKVRGNSEKLFSSEHYVYLICRYIVSNPIKIRIFALSTMPVSGQFSCPEEINNINSTNL